MESIPDLPSLVDPIASLLGGVFAQQCVQYSRSQALHTQEGRLAWPRTAEFCFCQHLFSWGTETLCCLLQGCRSDPTTEIAGTAFTGRMAVRIEVFQSLWNGVS